ncbi:hypothetical protein EJD97_024124 [Solanum chilense]|uniref:Uncharacterized protein n=1 Tax=Solanum chilense TaxID=4083 RepID=A0A6N2ARI2_SOLCI|nr:hypothetical protein EJD97_024124 [Solanum chilense]
MNTRRNTGRRVGEESSGGNQVPPQAPVVADQVAVNPDGLKDGEVRNSLLQMAHAITTQAQDITAQAAREGAPRENPHASTMDSKMRDFTRMNPLV